MCIGSLSDDDMILLKLRQLNIENLGNYVNVLSAENGPYDNYNCSKFDKLQEKAIKIGTIFRCN